jgi:hypothetical protein
MTMPIRFQHRRAKGFHGPEPFRVVTRSSRYGNPFRQSSQDPTERTEVVEQFRAWITAPEQAGLLARWREELRGLNLGCSCPVGLPCHADVLLDLVN